MHLLGATSPGCANLSLRTAAEEGANDLGKEEATFIMKTFYVDDELKSVPTPSEAIELIKNGTEIHEKGSFELLKFTSNSLEVVESILVAARAKNAYEIDLNLAPIPPERVLDVKWSIENKAFKFRITLKDKLTRRGIPSTVISVYALLGLAASFLLRGRRVLQMLSGENIGWDAATPDDLRKQ